jgi:hypothetical protein
MLVNLVKGECAVVVVQTDSATEPSSVRPGSGWRSTHGGHVQKDGDVVHV